MIARLFAAALIAAPVRVAAQEIAKPTTITGERLPAPARITAGQQPDGRIRVVWSGVEGATKYVLDRSVPNVGRGLVTLANPLDTGYVDGDVKAGFSYYYQVYAANGSTAGLKIAAPPVSAAISAGQVTTTASMPSDTTGSPTSGSSPSPTPTTAPADTTAATTTTTAPTSAGSAGAVTGLMATPGGASVMLSWTAPASDGGSPIDYYNVDVLKGSVSVATLTATATSRTVTGLPTCAYPSGLCGQSYQFRVRAHNGAGLGPTAATTAVPKVSYYGDNLPGLWQAKGCLGCHASSSPKLSATRPADYTAAKAEGALMYKKPSQSGVVHSGGTLFAATSSEYNAVYQWVLDGGLQ